MSLITESKVEEQALGWFREIGYQHTPGRAIAVGGDAAEREDYRAVILKGHLESALYRLNPEIPPTAIARVLANLLTPNIPGLMRLNKKAHQWLAKGMQILFTDKGREVGKQAKIIDFNNPEKNDWLVVNQFTVEGKSRQRRRVDLAVFVNGLPLAVLELKNAANEKADFLPAYNQLQTYVEEIPDMFAYNVCLAASDGIDARMGALGAGQERFMRWRMTDGKELDPLGKNNGLETLIKGVFNKELFLDYLRHFCLFEGTQTISKKIAGYHQFHAARLAADSLANASAANGDKKGGVVWHTQGAGKSIQMVCLVGRLISDPVLENPTVVVITDRQDLNDQLFDVFAGAPELLGRPPQRAESRAELRQILQSRAAGGVVFSTIQKFNLEPGEAKFPMLNNRNNIVVIADEAHRAQYGLNATMDAQTGQIKYGMAKHLRDALPNAAFLAFTGTPISQHDRDTRAVFGDYVSIYDIKQAVEDEATVPIYYESRLAKIDLNRPEMQQIDAEVQEILDTENADEKEKEKAKSKWTALAKIVGADPRLEQVAKDLIDHYEKRDKTQPGKALVVAMSREICVRLYDKIVALRPQWRGKNHNEGQIKVVMTTAPTDSAELRAHGTNNQQRRDLAKRFKDPQDPLKIVIVRDMWLTGFDAPCLAAMYVDKPMQGANLAQAIARVNRVFKGKPGGLVVDYIGIAPQLKEALATYTAAKGKGAPTIDSSVALDIFLKKIKEAGGILKPVDWSDFCKGDGKRALQLIPICMDRILAQKDGKRKFCDAVLQATKAFALCGTLDEAAPFAKELAFLRALRAALIKISAETPDPIDHNFNLRDQLSKAIVGDGVEDVFELAGIKSKPDISILSDEFLRDVKNMQHRNLAVELLQRLLRDKIKSKFKANIVMQRKFSELLENSLRNYANRSIETAQVVQELIAMAKDMQKSLERAKKLNLRTDEQAFYDALADNESAQEAMKEEALVELAQKVAERLRKNLTVDWTSQDSVRARLRLLVKNLLRRYKYPPDQQKKAVELVLEQVDELAKEGAVA